MKHRSRLQRLVIALRLAAFLMLFVGAWTTRLNAQREGNIWYFGGKAGMNFNGGAPVALTNSAMDTYEGCASVSSPNGNLLFYTDGITIYNASHSPMANGTGLLGDPSTSQSGVIVKVPGSQNRYYVFSVDDDGGQDGLRYSIVDMSLNGGQGGVTIKNVLLVTPVTERITAVAHRNGLDIWILVHEWNSNNYISYLLTPSGLMAPVYTPIGQVHGGNVFNSRGCMKVSPNGKWLATAITFQSRVDLLAFDDSLGTISNLTEIYGISGAYGVEFSPHSTRMYISSADVSPGELYQFDLTLPTRLDIVNSRYFIGRTSSLSMGSLQLGPDRKIYCARYDSPYLSVITQPDSLAAACMWVDDGFFLAGKRSYLGLPSFVQSYFLPPRANFNFTNPCFGDSTHFFGNSNYAPVNFSWNFGDPGSGQENYSTLQTPSHLYPAPGTYTVTLIIAKDSLRDTVVHQVVVQAFPNIDLGPADTILCDVPSITLSPGVAQYYLWSTGDTTSSITVTTDGLYIVEAGNGPCVITDSILVDFRTQPYVNLGVDRQFCSGDSVVLNAGNSGAIFNWSTGANSQTISVGSGGQYSVSVNIGQCIAFDTIQLAMLQRPVLDLGNDRSFCTDELELVAGTTFPTTWSTGATGPSIIITQSATVWAEAANAFCITRDTVHIDLFEPVRFDLGRDLVVCPNGTDSVLLIANFANSQYNWNTGETTQAIWVSQPGNYSVMVVSSDGCTGQDATEVVEDCEPLVFVPNAFTPNGDGQNDIFGIVGTGLSQMELQIYDRWGKLVFHSANINEGWDGKIGGVSAPEGAFVWQLRFRWREDPWQSLAGSVLLIR